MSLLVMMQILLESCLILVKLVLYKSEILPFIISNQHCIELEISLDN